MLGPQHVVRIPGLVMVLVAVLGSITIGADLAGEKEEREMYKFPVTWGTGMETLSHGSGNLQDGDSTEIKVQITVRNLTTVKFTLRWSDNLRFLGNIFPPDVTISVSDPNRTVIGEETGSSENSDLSISMNDINAPENLTEVEAGSYEEAQKEFQERCPARTDGMGTWTITISSDRSLLRMPLGRGSIDYTLNYDISYFYAELGEGGERQG